MAKGKKGKPTMPHKLKMPTPVDNSQPIATMGPQFSESVRTPAPKKFIVRHGSDKQAYSILDAEKGKIKPLPFPVLQGAKEPVMHLADAFGKQGSAIESSINKAGQIVFHALGDTGNTKGPKDEGLVSEKMVSDFDDTQSEAVPSFMYHLGDVVYSFGEAEYYYDQFYDPYREYPAPIFAIPGNHDGMVSPLNTKGTSLSAFIDNFCTDGQPPHRTPEAGGLARTAQLQPSVYFTLEAPFVRILGLYSNSLEDPGVISTQGGKFPGLTDVQLDYLKAALSRVKSDSFKGAVLIAVHHPPYTAQLNYDNVNDPAGRHGASLDMLAEIDACCQEAGVWPHAVISGHAHNMQRFTRRSKDGRETPFVICGNGGHAHNPLTRKGEPTIRTPADQPTLATNGDTVTFENYDDQQFGYLRIIVNDKQLRIEYHPASDGAESKTPDDFVTVDLATHKLVHYVPQ